MTASSPVTSVPVLTRRDRAVLTAVATGRCQVSGDPLPHLLIDGRCACDQVAAYQLLALGLIGPDPRRGGQRPSANEPLCATLTPEGWAALGGDRDSTLAGC